MSDARADLLRGLFDFAGLFPPASLDVPSAVAVHGRLSAHPHGWLVERFVAPATRVEAVGEAVGDAAAGAPWPIALVVEAPALRAAAEAAGRVVTAIRIDVVELRPLDAGEVAGAIEAARTVFPGAAVFAEVSPGDEAALDAVARTRAGVKLRCGGDRVPSTDELALVLRGCAERDVPLKATAGLHHAVADRVDGAWRHGFLNLLAAAALGGDVDALLESEPAALTVTPEAFAWRGRRLDVDAARSRVVGIGSCSFDEPVDELTALGVLPPARAAA